MTRRHLLLPLFVLAACAESGANDATTATTASTVLSFADEPAGANCAAGGTKITSGLDTNANGVLDDGEVKETRYVCNGAAGEGTDGGTTTTPPAAPRVDVEDEPKGANCPAGGVRIETGTDQDGNGKLDGAEITSTKYVCNAVAPDAGGSTAVVSVYSASGANVQSQANSVTVTSATIAAPGPGKVLAIVNGDLFCASPATGLGYDCNANGVTAGYYTLSTNATAAGDSGNADYFYLTPNATESTSLQASFDVAAAGNVTVYVRARTAGAGQFSMFRSTLSLIFVPS